MDLGKFSVSLAVEDLAASLRFYNALGFTKIGGDEAENWVILNNGTANIGLFQGMFKDNILTFVPTDARSIERAMLEAGLVIDTPTKGTEGPAHLIFRDPDGNVIMVDQHV